MTLPETMKAVRLTGHGGLDKLEWCDDVPVPQPDAGEVLISDYVLKHPDGRVAFVEIVGFWRKAYLERRIDLMEKLEGVPLVLVVGEKLKSDKGKLEDVPPAIVFFKTVIIVDRVLDAIEELCPAS